MKISNRIQTTKNHIFLLYHYKNADKQIFINIMSINIRILTKNWRLRRIIINILLRLTIYNCFIKFCLILVIKF